jgi:hypothetical protein
MYDIIAVQHSPLTLASKIRYKALVHFLISKGADVKLRMDGKSSALRLILYRIEFPIQEKPETLAERLYESYEFEDKPEVRSTIINIAHMLYTSWCGSA